VFFRLRGIHSRIVYNSAAAAAASTTHNERSSGAADYSCIAIILLELEVKIKEKTDILLFEKEAIHILQECKPRLRETKARVNKS
jgi:hypothetical protein